MESVCVMCVWVGVVLRCGEAGLTEQALLWLLFTYRDYLSPAGWWTASMAVGWGGGGVGGKQTYDRLHRESF